MQLANDQHGHEALEKTLQVARMNVRRVENPTPVEAVRPGPAQRRERPLTLQLDDAQNKEHIVQELRSSNDHLRNQVQQLKQLAHGAQKRYEADLQQAVRSLQEQYNSAVELLQLGASTGVLSAAHTTGQGMEGARGNGAAMTHNAGTTGPGPAHGMMGKGGPAAACKDRQGAAARASADPRANLLGLRADDLSPVASYGASVGLVTEPIAVLRDVLNLNQEHGQERPKSAAAAAVSGVSNGVAAGLAQAQFEARLRGAYRSMLLQVQNRYQLDRERQQQMHDIQLQELEERHQRALAALRAEQEAGMATAAHRLEQQAAAHRAEVQRLETQLSSARAAVDAAHGQLAASRAATEALQGQLQMQRAAHEAELQRAAQQAEQLRSEQQQALRGQRAAEQVAELQRAAHEAELQHVRQGTVPLAQHEEVVRQLKAEWGVALQQREADFAGLMAELASLRRQMSSSAGPSRSSGSCSGHSVAAPAAAAVATARGADSAYPPPPYPGGLHRPTARPPAPGPGHPRPKDHAPMPSALEETLRLLSGHQAHPHVQQAESWGGVAPDVGPPLPASGRPAAAEDHRGAADSRPLTAARPAPRAGEPLRPSISGSEMGRWAHGLDEHGSEVLTVSELTLAATPQSRHQPAAGGEPLTPHSTGSSSSLSALVQAVVRAGGARGEAAHQRGRSEPSEAAQAAEGGDGGGGGGGTGSCRGRMGSTDAMHSGLEGANTQQYRRCSSGGSQDGGTRAPAGGHGGTAGLGSNKNGGPAAVVQPPAWARRRDADGPGGDSGGGGDREEGGRSTGRGGQHGAFGATAELVGPREQSRSMRRKEQEHEEPSEMTLGGWQAAGEGHAGCGQKAGRRLTGVHQDHHDRRCQQHGPGQGHTPASPAGRRQGRPPGSPHPTWAASSGNKAANLAAPSCLRCGLDDATCPGCCCFHPALLGDPGSLRFTPEWMACHAAGHTRGTRGCYTRRTHFYQLQPTAPPSQQQLAGQQQQQVPGCQSQPCGRRRGVKAAVNEPPSGAGVEGVREAADEERAAWRAWAGSGAQGGHLSGGETGRQRHAGSGRGQGPMASPVGGRGRDTPHSPGPGQQRRRQAAAHGGSPLSRPGVGRATGVQGSPSPSPQPRRTLPVPAARMGHGR